MNINRPLSPHLTIYNPELTSALSIIHRITGTVMGITVFTSLILYKLFTYNITHYFFYKIAYALNQGSYWIISSIYYLLLFSLLYHFCNGIRHLLWDTGNILDIKEVYFSGYILIAISTLLTFLTWLIA